MFISVSYLLHSRCKLVLMFFTLSRIQQRPGARMKPNLPHVDAPYRRMNPQFSVPAFLPASAAQAPVFFVVINKVTLMTEPSKAAMFMCLFCFTKMLQVITIFVFLSFFTQANRRVFLQKRIASHNVSVVSTDCLGVSRQRSLKRRENNQVFE